VAPTGHFVTVDKLSAGERSVMINLTMVLRWLGPGGIVLLDEPELHQHSSLMRGNIAVLEAVVQDGGGQLIAASHADEVWQHFRARERIVDLSWP
jgi:predicted ATPase